ncbi:MAG: UDP-N-acetylmuramoyl-L-alanyl-D-glutamate--2,6-diaminopimelate ligase [Candidatus Peribacteraceae bacterium]|nr:UDP-N-acetylmuramoyl-L-alanyl-D-glutamate--2,6-diaminopimelate ligase [Candidatus Peribacteraceae bacterium]
MRRFLRTLKNLIPQRSPLRLWWHRARAFLAAAINGFPARRLMVIAVTGTDGKTTTVGMTAHILAMNGKKVGALSTAFLRIGKEITWNQTQKTSPSPFLIQHFLKDLVSAGCTHAVLEVSSHGLVQGRLNYTWPRIAGFTNLTPEHLDYHGTLEQYRKDKGLLFAMIPMDGTIVLNRDDASAAFFRSCTPARALFYSTRQRTDFRLSDSAHQNGSTRALLHAPDGHTHILALPVPGAFNLENALCAIACTSAAGVPVEDAVTALKSFRGVSGRMERIDEGQNFSVYVDFTVTPAAYEKTLSTLRTILPEGKRLLVLTGSCGDRMREKRPLVGEICSRLADVVVVTNEDPYTEDPQKIIDEVWAGMDQSACTAQKILDRREAMQWLLQQAKPGDAVILCAKGSDTTMMTAEGQVPWNEREIVREMLRMMKQ